MCGPSDRSNEYSQRPDFNYPQFRSPVPNYFPTESKKKKERKRETERERESDPARSKGVSNLGESLFAQP